MAMRSVSMKRVKNGPLVRKPKNVPYARHGSSSARSRLDREVWSRRLKDFVNMTTKQVIDNLKKDKILPEWKGAKCPYCNLGKLGPSKNCGKKSGGGERLADQAAVLFCAVAQCSQASARLLLKNNHKVAEGIYSALHAARAKYANAREKHIVFGKDQGGNELERADVGADEVDVAKGEDPNARPRSQKPIIWEQRGGIVHRGNPRSLVLLKLKPEKAKRRAPGPGPIRKRDWAPKAPRWLKHRRVVLHADGARSRKLKTDGVLRDWAVHKKKRVKLGRTWARVKPAFTKVRYHNVPDKSKPRGTQRLWVKRGTRLINRARGELRRAVGKGKAKEVNSISLRNKVSKGRRFHVLSGPCKVRSSQWAHWHRGCDLWLATGQMLRE
ncbi:unnamed protein product, partial [Prorocentrum cordatum]